MARVAGVVTMLALWSCGGGGADSTVNNPPAAAVASVVLSSDTATLVPHETVSITATPRDAQGNALTRPVTWSSSAAAIATVAQDGTITGVAAGPATISAAAEGKTATVQVTVRDGAVVGAAGGIAARPDSTVVVTIPAGALATQRQITITPASNPGPASSAIAGTLFDLGPNGTTFAQPIGVRIRYAPASLPAGTRQANLRLQHFEDGVWVVANGSSVDTLRHEVTGQALSFSAYSIGSAASGPTTAAIFVGGLKKKLDAQQQAFLDRWSGDTLTPINYQIIDFIVGDYPDEFDGGFPEGAGFDSDAGIRSALGPTSIGSQALFVGGQKDASSASSDWTGVFDLSTVSWTSIPKLLVPRQYPTVTSLPNGTLLVAGGFLNGVSDPLASTEVFDPTTRTFTPGPNLVEARGLHAAVALGNGKVLIVGGFSLSGGAAGAELFDPGSNTFAATGPMVTNRQFPLAALLPNGKVLIIGPTSMQTAELYDPASQTFSPTSGQMTVGRAEETLTPLPDGRVLIIGGVSFGAQPGAPVVPATTATEFYDPVTDRFSPGPALSVARRSHAAVVFPDGLVLVAGGVDQNGVELSSIEAWAPGTPAFVLQQVQLDRTRSGFMGVVLQTR